jgi:uncharacterized lipoprotein YbaY
MQQRPKDRRTVLVLLGAAVLAGANARALAQNADIRGTVTFSGDKTIPDGFLAIYLEDPGVADSARRRLAETRIESDGGATVVAFSLPRPANATAATARVVVRLERADGWLLARGSTRLDAGPTVEVTLDEVVY